MTGLLIALAVIVGLAVLVASWVALLALVDRRAR